MCSPEKRCLTHPRERSLWRSPPPWPAPVPPRSAHLSTTRDQWRPSLAPLLALDNQVPPPARRRSTATQRRSLSCRCVWRSRRPAGRILAPGADVQSKLGCRNAWRATYLPHPASPEPNQVAVASPPYLAEETRLRND